MSKRVRWNIDLINQKVNSIGKSKLLSTKYYWRDNLEFQCHCGEIFTRHWQEYLIGSGECKNCGRQELYDSLRADYSAVRERVESGGAKLLSQENEYKDKYTKLKILCICGDIFYRDWSSINSPRVIKNPVLCTKCSLRRGQEYKRYDYSEVKSYADSVGVELISTTYSNSNKDLEFRCQCGEIFKRSFYNFKLLKKHHCRKCAYALGGIRSKKRLPMSKVTSFFDKHQIKIVDISKYKTVTTKLDLVCKCGRNFKSSYFRLYLSRTRSCGYCSNTISTHEKEIASYIEDDLGIPIERNTKKIIPPKEIDIYSKDHNLAIEVNGLYWHSSKSKDKFYHQDKTFKLKSLGINLIHITDREWEDSCGLVKNLLQVNFNVGIKTINSDQLNFFEVSKHKAKQFIEENHIQGWVSSKINLGLFNGDELMSIMTFGKSRFNKNYQYELIRFCSKVGYTVVGGSNKLFKYFIENYNPTSVISYCDISKFSGKMYEDLGFSLLRYSKPDYFYFKGRDVYSRMKFQKHKLKESLDDYDGDLSEWENMSINGYDRYWDCGNAVYTWVKRNQ